MQMFYLELIWVLGEMEHTNRYLAVMLGSYDTLSMDEFRGSCTP